MAPEDVVVGFVPNPRIMHSALAIPYSLDLKGLSTRILGPSRWIDPHVARGEIFKDEQINSGLCTVEANPEELEADIGGSHAMHSI